MRKLLFTFLPVFYALFAFGQTPAINVGSLTDGSAASYELGFEFTTTSTIYITDIATFDKGGDGLISIATVNIWRVSDQAQIFVETIGTSEGYLEGLIRYKTLATPYVLPSGTYRITSNSDSEVGAFVFGSSPSTPPEITFGGAAYNNGGTTVTYPFNTDVNNVYFGATFKFNTCIPVNITTAPSENVCPSTMVTITGTSANGGTITWDNGITNGLAFEAIASTTYNYVSTNGDDCSGEVTIIVDETNPDTPTLADVTGECSATATVPTAEDACAGTITGTTSDALTYTTQGTHTITWNFDDGNGNNIDVTQDVVIDDVTNPVTPTLKDVTGECSATAVAPTTDDACAGTITGTTSDALTYTTQGTHTITWNFDDGNGNNIDVTQDVVIDDITNPTTPTLEDVTGECSATTVAPTTEDACAGTITGTTSDALTYDVQGTHTITWNFDDGNGNSIDVTQDVVIDDVSLPTITCLENQVITLLEGQTVYTVVGTEFDPTATDDNCSVAGVVNNFNSSTTLDTEELAIGTTTVEWTVTDGIGNEKSCSFDITVNTYVGISDLTELGISIYPNPSNGIFTIEAKDNYEITITDISGKIVKQLSITDNELSVDISNEAKGIYFIKFQNSETVKTVKIIME